MPRLRAASPGEPPRDALDGSFLQLLADHGRWEDADWARLFAYFRAMRLRRLVVQWSVHDALRFYASAGHGPSLSRPPMEAILAQAEAAGMQVLVGLVNESGFWQQIAKEPGEVARYLDGLRERSVACAGELLPIVGRFKSFAGWYIPEEIDDGSWRDPGRRKILSAHLGRLSRELRGVAPDAHIGVSGFSNATLDPASFGAFWSTLLEGAEGIDTVFLQDGVGTGKLGVPEASMYLGAMAEAARSRTRELVAIVEVFTQVTGPPLDNGAFSAVPAPLERIRQQVAAARRHAPSVIAFSVPEYLTPLGGPQAARLHERYLLRFFDAPSSEARASS